MWDVVPPLDGVVEVEAVAGHVEPEDREVQRVVPERVPLPALVDQMEDREEHREPHEDPDVSRPERLARKARIARVHERIDREDEDRDAQADVEERARLAQDLADVAPQDRPADPTTSHDALCGTHRHRAMATAMPDLFSLRSARYDGRAPKR